MSDKISSFFPSFFFRLCHPKCRTVWPLTLFISTKGHTVCELVWKKKRSLFEKKKTREKVCVSNTFQLFRRVCFLLFFFGLKKKRERKKMRSFHAEAVYLCNHPPPLPNESLRQSRDSTRYLRNQGGGSQRPIFSWYWVWYVYTRLCGNPGSPSLSLSSTIFFFYMDVHYFYWCSGGVVITISCWWPRYFRASLYGCLSLLASCCCLMIVCACVWCVCMCIG